MGGGRSDPCQNFVGALFEQQNAFLVVQVVQGLVKENQSRLYSVFFLIWLIFVLIVGLTKDKLRNPSNGIGKEILINKISKGWITLTILSCGA